MTIIELQYLTNQVLACSFVVSYLLGFIVHRSHFCTMGAIADIFLMQDWARAYQWMTATGLAMLGFGMLSVGGLIDPTKTLYASAKWYWASTLTGGFLFGFGMVLSSGCGLKSLVRAGAGNLKSLVVLIVMGSFAFMTIKGVFAVIRVATIDHLAVNISGGANWANLLGFASVDQWGWFAIASSVLFLVAILCFKKARESSNLITGLLIGSLFVGIWWVGGYMGHVAEHPDTLEEVFVGSKSGRIEAFSFVGPVAYFWNWLEFYSDKSNLLSTGVISVIGVFTGSLTSALTNSTFKWEGFSQNEDMGFHLSGAVMMGIGGVLALGCTVGQGISGLSTLSLNASTALLGIISGAWISLSLRSNIVDCKTI